MRRKPRSLEPLGLRAGLRVDELELVAARSATGSAPALGLTQIQSRPGGGGRVPLVSTATSKPAACSAATAGPSSCSSGSPPVHTTQRPAALVRLAPAQVAGHGGGQVGGGSEPAAAGPVGADEVGVAELADGPVPVRSRPVHRLQLANRQNTAGRPAWPPSPWRV